MRFSGRIREVCAFVVPIPLSLPRSAYWVAVAGRRGHAAGHALDLPRADDRPDGRRRRPRRPGPRAALRLGRARRSASRCGRSARSGRSSATCYGAARRRSRPGRRAAGSPIYPCTLVDLRRARPAVAAARAAHHARARDAAMLVLGAAAVVTAAVLPAADSPTPASISGSARRSSRSPTRSATASLLTRRADRRRRRRLARRRGLARCWPLGSVALVVGDVLWTLQAAAGTWQPVMGSNAVYPLWPGLAAARRLAAAAARRARSSPARSVRTHAAVLVAVVAAIALLVANEWVDVPAAVGRARRGRRCSAPSTGPRSRSPPACARRSPPAASASSSTTSATRSSDGELDLHFQPLVDARTRRRPRRRGAAALAPSACAAGPVPARRRALAS